MDFEEEEDEEEQEKVKGPKFPLCMYITEGTKYLKLQMFDKALECFNTALEREPKNEKSLLGRTKCYICKGMYSEAKTSAETALNFNPKSAEAKLFKAEVEYFLGDFERSFITYSRAHDSRPNYGAFKLGYQSCRKAIDNALRPDVAIFLEDDDIENIIELLRGKQLEGMDDGKPGTSRKSKLYEDDIKYLKHMLSDETMTSIHSECRNLLEYLEERQQFWRYQDPRTRKRRSKLRTPQDKKDD